VSLAAGAQSTDLHSPLSQNFALEARRSSIHRYFPRNFAPPPLPLLFSQSISICLHSEGSRNRSFGRVQAVPEEYQALSGGIGVENGKKQNRQVAIGYQRETAIAYITITFLELARWPTKETARVWILSNLSIYQCHSPLHHDPGLNCVTEQCKKTKAKKCRSNWKNVCSRKKINADTEFRLPLISRFLLYCLYSRNNAARWEY